MKNNDLSRFLALDCATTNTGFALFHNEVPVKYGKLHFDGHAEYDKVISAAQTMYAFVKEFPVSTIVIESSFFGTNPKVATNLALSQGAALAGASLAGVTHIGSVVPSQWQRGIGNALLTREEKAAIMKEFPKKSASWYKTFGRTLRKTRTVDIVNDRFDLAVGDYDVADAVGIGLYVSINPEGVSW
jgi:Holliday junction resolvasome RuvABC endonuclease subunit